MNRIAEKKLADEFPFLRVYKSCDEQEGYKEELYTAFEIECDDGWYYLIHDLCTDIMNEYNKAGRPVDLVLDQVKEKYGTLRFYYRFKGQPRGFHAIDIFGIGSMRMTPQEDGFEKNISEIVQRYEEKSGTICGRCGAKGILRKDLRLFETLCDEHYKEAKKEDK